MAGHTSHIARRTRFLFLDSITALPLLIWCFRITEWRLLAVGLAFAFSLWLLERRGLPLPVAIRRLRVLLRGPRTRLRPPISH